MAQLLLINAMTLRPGVNEIGDVVGVFSDEHIFSPAEISGFDIHRIESKTKEEVEKIFSDTKGKDTDSLKSPKYLFKIIDKAEIDISKAISFKGVKKE